MAKILSNYITTIQGFIKDKTPPTRNVIKDWVNEGVGEVWNAHDWEWKKMRLRVNTIAPYTTGTVTIANGSTALTISGGDLTGLEDYKFASAIGEPWFRISSVASGGASATLESAFTETSLSGSTFVVYKDIYNLDADVDEIHAVKLFTNNYPRLKCIGENELDRYESFSSRSGDPEAWFIAPRFAATDQRAIGFYPIPDAVYPIEIRYNKVAPVMNADSDTAFPLPVDFEPLVIAYALELAASYDYLDQKSVLAAQRYEKLLLRKIRTYTEVVDAEGTWAPYDSGPGRYLDPNYNFDDFNWTP